jgi:hypothetical protein
MVRVYGPGKQILNLDAVTSHNCCNMLGSFSSTTMASPPTGKKSKIHGWLNVPRRVFNRARDATSPNIGPALPITANINIPNDDLGVVRDRPHAILSTPHSSQCSSALLATGVEGNRSQDTVFTTLDPSSQQSSSHPETNTSEKIKKAWGVTQSGLLTALRLLEMSASAFPPLRSAVGGLVACLDLAQVSYSCGFNTIYHV